MSRSHRPLAALLLTAAAVLPAAGPLPRARASAAKPAVRKPALKEVRGVWVVRTDLTSPQAVARVVGHAKDNGLNTLFVQCRGRGDAYYNDGLEPRAQSLEKCAPDFDPLAEAVEAGKAAGLRVHAWVNACYVWSEKQAPTSPDHILNAQPEWLAVDRTGRRCRAGDKEVFICPGNPEARRHLVAVCRDIIRRYDLDGLQLDYIRYAGDHLCYCRGCMDRFQQLLGRTVPPARLAALRKQGRVSLSRAYPSSWGRFRRDQITSLVREIRQAVKSERPSAQLSAAVIPWGTFHADFRRSMAYATVAQDWYGWMRAGLVDAVCPMTYQTNAAAFNTWVKGIRRAHPDFPVWFGIGAYLFGPESAAAKVRTVRSIRGDGWVLFSYTSVTKGGTSDAYLRTLKARVIGTQSAGATEDDAGPGKDGSE